MSALAEPQPPGTLDFRMEERAQYKVKSVGGGSSAFRKYRDVMYGDRGLGYVLAA